MKKLIILSLCTLAAAFGQATFPVQVPGEAAVSVTLSAQAVPSVQAFILSQTITPSTTLASPATAADTTLTLTSATGVTVGTGLLIGSEVSLVTGMAGNVATVTRGSFATTKTTHATGDTVTILRSGSYSVFLANVLSDAIRTIMVSNPGPTISTANAAIAAQQATITSTVAAGVTHVP